MCKCKRPVGVIVAGAFTGLALISYCIWIGFIANANQATSTLTGELTILSILLANKCVNCAFYIYYAVV